MAIDWISNLFQSEQTRGLSGGADAGLALDESNPYYNYRLRQHRAEGDLIANPALLWEAVPRSGRPGGLGAHIAAEKGEGVAGFTDVLLILSLDDYSRAVNATKEPWLQTATRSLLQEFENFCRRESFRRIYAHRQLGFRILCDGSADMGGQALGLGAGEFVTGLLPNLYTGPVRGSYPVVGVYLNLPGVWEGYQEVGRLYNDQLLFTLGNHWLDNFSQPSLREGALYRLQQYPDGGFGHVINPDLQDRYQVSSTDQGGASVLTLSTREGEPLAYLVLALIDPPAQQRAPSAKPGIAMPSPMDAPEGDIAPPMLIDDELQPIGGGSLRSSRTIIPDAPAERIFTLQERGALLQKVHFGAFMEGYDVFVGRRGELGTVVENPAATFQVRKKSVSLEAHVPGVSVNGQPVPAGRARELSGDTTINVAGTSLEYRDQRGLDADAWPYVGEIRCPASSTYLSWGDEFLIGRSRDCRVVLPDEPRNDNIHWKESVVDGAMIRARTGDIPKSRFYTDSIMVASEHAAIDLRRDQPRAVCTGRHTYVYVRRSGSVTPLFPTSSGREPQAMDLRPGDELLIGNCLFQVSYSAGEAAQPVAPLAAAPTPMTPAPAPARPSATQLAAAVSEPDLERLGAPTEPPFDGDAFDAPAPAAFGGRTPPAPVPMQPAGNISLGGALDDFADFADFSDPPSRDHDEDGEATIPGAPIPAAVLSAMQAPAERPIDLFEEDGSLVAPEPHALALQPEEEPEDAPAPPPPPAALPAEPVDEWDEDSWSDAVEAPDPSEPVGAHSVPPPFPEVEEEETAAEDTMDVPELPPPPPAEAPRSFSLPPMMPSSVAAAASPEPLEAPAPPPAPLAPAPPAAIAPAAPAAPAITPPPAPVASAPPAPAAERGTGEVVAVDEESAQFELGRSVHLVQIGWTINGSAVCGNHSGADLVLPESRVSPDQDFRARDYFEIKVRNRKGHIEVLSPEEMFVDESDATAGLYEEPEDRVLDVIRRDDQGQEDFAVRLQVVRDKSLPDPRASLLAIDVEEPLVAALFTKGLPTRAERVLELGGVRVTFLFDGEVVRLRDYLGTYRTPAGFRPFFVQRGAERFRTAPEDGSEIALHPGDRIVLGASVYLLRQE